MHNLESITNEYSTYYAAVTEKNSFDEYYVSKVIQTKDEHDSIQSIHYEDVKILFSTEMNTLRLES